MITYVVNNNLGNSFSSIQIYIDGVLANTASYNGSTTVNTTNLATLIFGNSNKLNRYLHGKLDDIVIWNRALTTAEIQQLYTLGQATYSWSNGATTPSITVSPTTTTTYTCTVTANGLSSSASSTVSIIPSSSITTTSSSICEGQSTTLTATAPTSINSCSTLSGTLTNGLVGYWPFCGNANDESGNGNNGTVNGATLTTDRFGNTNSAYSFDGVNDIITLPADLNTYSTSVWINASNQLNQFAEIFYYENSSTSIVQNGNYLYIRKQNESISSIDLSSSSISNSNWIHLLIIINQSSNQIQLYINSILIGTSQNALGGLYDYSTLNNNFYLGGRGFNSTNFYSGKLADIGI